MVYGAVRIETRVGRWSSEPGIYRITEDKQRYLMLAFDNPDEARIVGKEIAKLLEVPFKDHIYIEPKLDGAKMSMTIVAGQPKLFTRPKKVMGAPKLCEEMLTEGKLTDQEIKTIFADKYIQVGHKPIKAMELAKWLLKASKKKVAVGE